MCKDLFFGSKEIAGKGGQTDKLEFESIKILTC